MNRARSRLVPTFVPTYLVGALVLTACASPGDVIAERDAALRGREETLDRYAADLAFAEEWNQHVLGVPAAGWVALLSIGAVLVAALLGVAIYFIARARTDARGKRHELNRERERTRRAVVERGACDTCGASPLPTDVRVRLQDDR